jgi:SAM-dependent methyltransferase
MTREWQGNPVVREAVNRRLTGRPNLDPVEYFQQRYCMFDPKPLALLLGPADADFAVACVRVGICERIVGLDDSRDRVDRAVASIPADLRDRVEFLLEGTGSHAAGAPYELIIARDVLSGIADLPAWCRAVASLLDEDGMLWVDDYVGPQPSQIVDRVLATVEGAAPAPAQLGPQGVRATLEEHLGVVHPGDYGGALWTRFAGGDDAQLRTLIEMDFLLTDVGALEPEYLWAVYERPSAEARPPEPAVAPGERPELPLPPEPLMFMQEDYDGLRRNGEEIVVDLEDLCHLHPHSAVLDIGSGYGRLAHALWRHDYAGPYLGLELLPRHARWCEETLTPASGGVFHFHHLDIANARYNPGGKLKADELTLPVEDASVDIGVLTSVFTHMYPAEIENYLGELGRILKPGGRVLATWFIVDERWQESALAGALKGITMEYVLQDGVRYYNAEDPLWAIGYSPAWIRRASARAGLRIQASRPGSWAGDEASGPNIQDLMILTRV